MNEETKNDKVDIVMDQFINDLTIEAGVVEKLEGNEDVLVQFKKDLKERLENRINAMILSQIPQGKLEKFEELLDLSKKDEMHAFCAENIPNLTELMAAEFLNFRSRYIDSNK